MDDSLALVLTGAIIAGFVQGLSGFAFGLTAMSFWAWAVAPQLAGPLVVVCSLAGQSLAIGPLRRGFDWRRVLPFVLGGAMGVPLGVGLLPLVDPVLFRVILGTILVGYCSCMLAARLLPHLHHGGRLADGAIGMVGGVLGGLGGFTGTPVTLWYTLRGWDKDSGRAVLQTFNIAMHALTLTVYALNGLVTADLGWLCLWAVPAMVVPALIGIRLYDRIDDAAFRRLILMLLLVSGVVLLATSLPRLLGL